MPLAFDDRSLLPVGIHDATLAEIDQHLARFQRSDRRIRLFEKLKQYLTELQRTGWPCEVLIDGSFVMPCVDEPNDIDLILVLPADWDNTKQLKPFEYNVLSKTYTKKTYAIEVYAVASNSERQKQMIDLFEQVRVSWCEQFGWPHDSRKGIVRIVV